MQKADVVFFSPHLDDAVLSCAGRICRSATSGMRLLVVNIFSSSGQKPNAAYLKRYEEDAAAMAICGALSREMGFLDAPFRNPFYNSLSSVLFGFHDDDKNTVLRLQQGMDDIMAECQASEAFFPLAIGGHIDHRLTFEASEALNFSGTKFFYEERPYVFYPNNPQRRLKQLGVQLRPGPGWPEAQPGFGVSLLQSIKIIFSLNLRSQYLPSLTDGLRCLRQYYQSSCKTAVIRRLEPEIHRMDRETFDRALQAIGCYSSQVALLTGSLRRWRTCAERYSRTYGDTNAERYWRCPD